MALRRVLSSCVSSWGAARKQGNHWSLCVRDDKCAMRKGFGMGFEREKMSVLLQ